MSSMRWKILYFKCFTRSLVELQSWLSHIREKYFLQVRKFQQINSCLEIIGEFCGGYVIVLINLAFLSMFVPRFVSLTLLSIHSCHSFFKIHHERHSFTNKWHISLSRTVKIHYLVDQFRRRSGGLYVVLEMHFHVVILVKHRVSPEAIFIFTLCSFVTMCPVFAENSSAWILGIVLGRVVLCVQQPIPFHV